MSNRVDTVKNIKTKLKTNDFKCSNDLKHEIDSIIDYYYESLGLHSNEDFYDKNLFEYSIFQQFIIQENINILKTELLVGQDISSNVYKTVTQALYHINNKTQYHKMYFLNDDAEFIIIGDLHSDYDSLVRAIDCTNFYKNILEGKAVYLVFAGDYVDRGHTHLKLMEMLLLLKYLFPQNVFCIRGNHDGGIIADDGSLIYPYRIPKIDLPQMYFPYYVKTLNEKNNTYSNTLPLFLEFFNYLPYITFIKSKMLNVMVVHGGIPRPYYLSDDRYEYLKEIKDLTDDNITDYLGSSITKNLFWSDPLRDTNKHTIDYRRFHFSESDCMQFMSKFNIDLIIRGHEAFEEGYCEHFNGRVITIFSSGSIYESKTNHNTNYIGVKPKVISLKDGLVRYI